MTFLSSRTRQTEPAEEMCRGARADWNSRASGFIYSVFSKKYIIQLCCQKICSIWFAEVSTRWRCWIHTPRAKLTNKIRARRIIPPSPIVVFFFTSNKLLHLFASSRFCCCLIGGEHFIFSPSELLILAPRRHRLWWWWWCTLIYNVTWNIWKNTSLSD